MHLEAQKNYHSTSLFPVRSLTVLTARALWTKRIYLVTFRQYSNQPLCIGDANSRDMTDLSHKSKPLFLLQTFIKLYSLTILSLEFFLLRCFFCAPILSNRQIEISRTQSNLTIVQFAFFTGTEFEWRFHWINLLFPIKNSYSVDAYSNLYLHISHFSAPLSPISTYDFAKPFYQNPSCIGIGWFRAIGLGWNVIWKALKLHPDN